MGAKMKKLLILFYICSCFISTSTLASAPGSCIEFAGVNGKRYCYSENDVHPFRNAFSYCHALGYHQASSNELCDISSEPSERFVRSDGNGPDGGCKNLMGLNIPGSNYWTAGLYNGTWADALVITMPGGTPNNSNPTYSGRHAVCYIGGCAAGFVADGDRCVGCGSTQPTDPSTITVRACCEHWEFEWDTVSNTCGCPDGYFWNETLQSCEELGPFCSYTYHAANTTSKKSDCQYNYTISNGVGTVSSSSPRGGCPANQFCALDWSNENCSSSISDSDSVIYGVCSPKDLYYIMCHATYDPGSVDVDKGCPAGKFCYLTWRDEQCNGINDNATKYYGACVDKDISETPSCPAS